MSRCGYVYMTIYDFQSISSSNDLECVLINVCSVSEYNLNQIWTI